MERLPITVVIPTLNAGGHIDELLDSILPYVEEIFIVDSFSVDKTVDIAIKRGVKIIQRRYVNSSNQFGWMLRTLPINTKWLFFMAQDERFTDSLVEAMHTLFANEIPTDVDGYTINWRLWFMGQPLHAMVPNLRLMRVGRCDVTNVACNEHFTVRGEVLHLNGILEHKDTLNFYEWYEKQNLWTTREAIQRVNPPSEDEKPLWKGTKRQKKAFIKQFLIHMPFGKCVLFWYYLLKFGAWRDGWAGWTWAKLRVWVHHVTTLKEIEMRKYGIPKILPEGQHGAPDARILNSELQKKLIPIGV